MYDPARAELKSRSSPEGPSGPFSAVSAVPRVAYTRQESLRLRGCSARSASLRSNAETLFGPCQIAACEATSSTRCRRVPPTDCYVIVTSRSLFE